MGSSNPSADLSTEELFRRFAPFVARFLYRLGVDSDGLDDVVQEVFVVVHRRGGYKAGPAKPTSYLATIATNAASAYRRRRRIEQARSSDAEVEGLVSTNKGPVQVLEVGERLRLLQAALDRLEPEFRSTLILADIEGESCASIAASSGVPTGTVYWRLHEARKRFQRALKAQAAGIPARGAPAEAALPSENERRSVLAFALNPLWFLSDARKLLRAGAAQPPIAYDVGLGLDKHRQLASATALPSHPPVIAPASVAAHASAGLGIVGASTASVAVIAVIAARLLSHPAAQSEEAHAAEAHVVPTTATAPIPAPLVPSAKPVVPTEAPAAGSASSEVPQGGPSSGAVTDHLDGRTGTMTAPRTASATSKAREASSTPTSSSSHSPALAEHHDPVTPSAPSAPATTQADTQAEAREIARAERMLSSNPAGALAVVRDARSRFTRSFLTEERDYVEVMALNALGRAGEARAAATRFLRAYPGGAFANRVRKVMAK